MSLKHIAIIPDGNRRWAKEKGLASMDGHRQGYERFKQFGDWALARGIEHVTFWAFSTENWKRSKEEVGYLMDLLLFALTKESEEYHKRNVRLKVIGRREELSPALQHAIKDLEENTKNNTRGQVNLCLNYGGRAELVHAVQEIVASGISKDTVTEELISRSLWTADIPEPDLVIRTGGEKRLSGFEPWQTIYSEWAFEDMYWPDFTEADFDRVLADYAERERRYGA